MVFQNYGLYPHMTVAREHRLSAQGRAACRARSATRRVRRGGGARRARRTSRPPARRSFRAASASASRSAAPSCATPQAVPDGRAAVQSRRQAARRRCAREIKHLQRELGITTIYVTHDQVEAMTLADRVAVMSDGRLQQVGPPLEIYNRPANVFVAGFLGNPADEPDPEARSAGGRFRERRAFACRSRLRCRRAVAARASGPEDMAPRRTGRRATCRRRGLHRRAARRQHARRRSGSATSSSPSRPTRTARRASARPSASASSRGACTSSTGSRRAARRWSGPMPRGREAGASR